MYKPWKSHLEGEQLYLGGQQRSPWLPFYLLEKGWSSKYSLGCFRKQGVFPPNHPTLIRFSIIFTIRFGGTVPLFLVQHPPLDFPCSKATPLGWSYIYIYPGHVTGLRERLKLSHLLHSSMAWRALKRREWTSHIWRNAWKLGQTYIQHHGETTQWEPVQTYVSKKCTLRRCCDTCPMLYKSAWQDASEQSQHTSLKYNTSPKFQEGQKDNMAQRVSETPSNSWRLKNHMDLLLRWHDPNWRAIHFTNHPLFSNSQHTFDVIHFIKQILSFRVFMQIPPGNEHWSLYNCVEFSSISSPNPTQPWKQKSPWSLPQPCFLQGALGFAPPGRFHGIQRFFSHRGTSTAKKGFLVG